MKLNKTLTIIALAAASLCTTSPLQAQDAPKDKPAGEQAPPAGQPPRRPGIISLENIAKQLDLNDEQKAKVKPVIEEMQQKIADSRKELQGASMEDRRAKMKEIREAASAKLKGILTPEQYQKWEKLTPARRPANGGTPPAAPAAGEEKKN
ncbi:MAG TPA: hypothetical protein VF607_06765 [Verrucomicrobiae bacterium]